MATNTGFFISVLLMIIMVMYGSVKFMYLISRNNPNISSVLRKSAYDAYDSLNLKNTSIRFAFGLEGYFDKESKVNPNFVYSIFDLLMPKQKC